MTGVCRIEADKSDVLASIALFVTVLISIWVTVYTLVLTYLAGQPLQAWLSESVVFPMIKVNKITTAC